MVTKPDLAIFFVTARSTIILNTSPKNALMGIAILLAMSQWSLAEDNPHWNEATCGTCHVAAAPVAGNTGLKAPDAESLCESCHGDRGDARPCRHASDMSVGDLIIPEIFQASLKEEKVVCTTCHDVVYQCERPKTYYSFDNPGFLRDGEFGKQEEYCFKCHDSSEYEQLNPHTGVAGSPPGQTCTLCHENIPNSSASDTLDVTFNIRGDLNNMCQGCHKVRPHPNNLFSSRRSGEWIAILKNMRESEDETGVKLPLNPRNGEVYCATCHNPHEFKFGGTHGSQSRDAQHRLRLNEICQACHDR
jgi:hypothetical protein